MKKPTIFTLFLAFLMCSCLNTNQPVKSTKYSILTSSHISLQDNEYIYWVNSLKAACVGVAPKQCLRIQKGDTVTADGWQLFYDTIKGFKYKQGYIYKLIVREESIPADRVPADASSKKYSLVKLLEKRVDGKLRLYNIWALESIKGRQFSVADRQQRPRLEINLKEMALVGNDGCNDFLGRIASVDSNELTFAPLATTMKACDDMNIPDRFHQHINSVQTYAIQGLKLYLFDSKGNELFCFQKIN